MKYLFCLVQCGEPGVSVLTTSLNGAVLVTEVMIARRVSSRAIHAIKHIHHN